MSRGYDYLVQERGVDANRIFLIGHSRGAVLSSIAGAAENLGLAVVMLDLLDCGDPERVARRKALYQSYGFTSLPSNPLRMFLPLATVRALIEQLDAASE